MISPQDFRSRYISAVEALAAGFPLLPEVDEEMRSFVEFDSKTLADWGVDEQTSAFLLEAGLPASAAPFLAFDRLEEAFKAQGLSEDYYPLGSNGCGDPIVIDIPTQRVLLLRHDEDMRPTYANATIAHFAETLCLMAEHFEMDGPEAFFVALRVIDPAAVDQDTMWSAEGHAISGTNTEFGAEP